VRNSLGALANAVKFTEQGGVTLRVGVVGSGQVLALLDQLPPDQTTLVESLTALVHSFRFDKIVSLTQEEKNNAYPSI
jgi:hypothetical protein